MVLCSLGQSLAVPRERGLGGLLTRTENSSKNEKGKYL